MQSQSWIALSVNWKRQPNPPPTKNGPPGSGPFGKATVTAAPFTQSNPPSGSGEISQDVALLLQLAAIAGNEPASSFIEIRPLDRNCVQRSRCWFPVRELRRAAERITELAPRLNVYVGAAPRTREAGTKDAVARAWCLWADCDGRDTLTRLAAFRPLPSIVNRTGGDNHAHAYWPLREPLGAAWAERSNRRLALELGADPKATDRARILRAAGTTNHKHDAPVVCTRLETADVFTWSEVVGRLPDDRCYQPLRHPEPMRSADPAGSVDRLARVVRAAEVGNRNGSLYWAANRLRDDGLDTSEARAMLHAAAIVAGLDEHEITATLRSALDTARAA
jgi:hypothetical protein